MFSCFRTLAIIKPDAIRMKGDILQALTRDGFKVVQLQMCQLTKEQAQAFYAEHNGQSFFKLENFFRTENWKQSSKN